MFAFRIKLHKFGKKSFQYSHELLITYKCLKTVFNLLTLWEVSTQFMEEKQTYIDSWDYIIYNFVS